MNERFRTMTDEELGTAIIRLGPEIVWPATRTSDGPSARRSWNSVTRHPSSPPGSASRAAAERCS